MRLLAAAMTNVDTRWNRSTRCRVPKRQRLSKRTPSCHTNCCSHHSWRAAASSLYAFVRSSAQRATLSCPRSPSSIPAPRATVLTMATASASFEITGSLTLPRASGSIMSFRESDPGAATESSDVTLHFLTLTSSPPTSFHLSCATTFFGGNLAGTVKR